MMIAIKHYLEYAVVVFLGRLARSLPFRLALSAGSFLGRVLWYSRVRRDVINTNLRLAFGDSLSERKMRTIGRKSCEEMGRSMIDFLLMPVIAGGAWSDYIDVQGREHIEAAIAGGTGAVMLSGHLGSSELITTAVVGMGFPVRLVIGTQKNPWVNEICKELRMSSGAGIIEEKDVVREAMRTLRSGTSVGFLADQDAGRDGVFVDFLGTQASTPGGGAAFAVRTGAAVIVCIIIRDGLKQKLHFEPPAYFERTGDRQEDMRAPTQYFTSVLERHVREHPEMYFWLHKRWKTRPWGRVGAYTLENIMRQKG